MASVTPCPACSFSPDNNGGVLGYMYFFGQSVFFLFIEKDCNVSEVS